MSKIDYSVLALPKGAPIGVLTERRRNARKSKDEAESAKVKKRSSGRCEVVIVSRCKRRAAPGVHHMISGIGVRARGISALARHKQDVCTECHSLITSKKLRRVGGEPPVWTDRYVRVR